MFARTSNLSRLRVGLVVFWQVAIVLLWLPVPAQAQPPTTQPEHWRADLRYLADELPRRHPNLFFSYPASEFQRNVNELHEAIPSLPEHVIITRLVQLVARCNDAHTLVDWSATTFRRYPLQLQALLDQNGNEGAYVTAVTTETQASNRGAVGYKRALGARLVRIGDTPIEVAGLAVAALISTENAQWIRARISAFITIPEFLHALGLLPEMERGRFTFEDAQRQQFELEFKPLARNVAVNWLTAPFLRRGSAPLRSTRPASVFYWYEYLAAQRTVYFQYNRCAELPGVPLAGFIQELLNFIDSNPVDRLVVDLRGNTGGNSALLQPFINGIRARPLLNQVGRLFVLIDRATFSSGMLNAFDLQTRTNATLAGEATGGKPNGYGEVRDFFLPNSNLRVVHSTRLFQIVPGNPSSLFPSLTVELAIEDYLAGRDAVLERVLANP